MNTIQDDSSATESKVDTEPLSSPRSIPPPEATAEEPHRERRMVETVEPAIPHAVQSTGFSFASFRNQQNVNGVEYLDPNPRNSWSRELLEKLGVKPNKIKSVKPESEHPEIYLKEPEFDWESSRHGIHFRTNKNDIKRVTLPWTYQMKLESAKHHNPPKREVYIRENSKSNRVILFDGKVRQIHSVKMAEETFSATFHFYLTWLATDQDIDSFANCKKDEDWVAPSTPRILIENAMGSEAILTTCKLKMLKFQWVKDGLEQVYGFDLRFGVFVRALFEFRGELLEEFELQSFPFDWQDVKMIIKVKDEKACVVPIAGNVLSYNTDKSALADFRVKAVLAEFGKTVAQQSRAGFKEYARVAIVLKLRRNWQSRWHILIAVAVLAGLALGVFVMLPRPTDDIGNRLNYLITLILTDITLQQSVQDKIDDIGYLTAMDKFMVSAFIFKVVILVWVCVPFYPMYDSEIFVDVVHMNQAATWVSVIAYIVFMAYWVTHFVVLSHLEKAKLYKGSRQLDRELNASERSSFSMHLHRDAVDAFLDPDGKDEELIHYAAEDKLQEMWDKPPPAHIEYTDVMNEVMGNVDIKKDVPPMEVSNRVAFLVVLVCVLVTLAIEYFMRRYPVPVFRAVMYQTVAVYGSCLFVGFIDWRFGGDNPHDLGMHLAVILQGIVGVSLMVHVESNRPLYIRAFAMQIGAMTWYGIRFVCDAFRLANSKRSFLVGKHTKVGKHCDNFGWFAVSALQGVRVILSLLPIIVMQSAAANNHWDGLNTLQVVDVVGAVVVLLAFPVAVSSYWFERPVMAIDMSQDIDRPSDVRQVSEERPRREESDDGLKPLMSDLEETKEAIEMESSHDASPHADMDRTQPKYGASEHDLPIPMLSPFTHVRYPLRLAEVVIWIGFWIMSTAVYKFDIANLISLLSPISVYLYHAVISVPLLDYFQDHAFAFYLPYERWKANSCALHPFF